MRITLLLIFELIIMGWVDMFDPQWAKKLESSVALQTNSNETIAAVLIIHQWLLVVLFISFFFN